MCFFFFFYCFKNKMQEFSIVDGFMDVNEFCADMIKHIANEPSVGLFFVQQHTQNAAPNLVNIKDKVLEGSHATALHTEDLEDSINVVRSMKECGMPIVDEMIEDIRKSLTIMSTSQPKRGVIRRSSSSFQIGRSRSWAPTAADRSNQSSSGYLSTVLNSAKQRAAGLRWNQLDPTVPRNLDVDKLLVSHTEPFSETVPGVEIEGDELLPLSSQMGEEPFDEQPSVIQSSSVHDPSLISDNYEKFRSDREAKLEEWLGELENYDAQVVEAGADNPFRLLEKSG